MRNLKELKKKSNNKGFSFILVIVAIGVVSLLIAVVLLLAYQNYTMKVTGLKSEDNFYSAEQVLDEIKAGLQGDMSEAVSEAYSYVMEHYTETNEQDGVRNWYFQTQYVDNLYDKLVASGSAGEYNLTYLSSYVIQGSPEEASYAAVPTALDADTPEGVTVEYKDGSKVELLCAMANEPVAFATEGTLTQTKTPLQFSYSKGVTINGLTVRYTNAQGYLSVVSTDLVLGIPAINFTQTASSPDLLSYALVANEKLGVANNLGGRSTIDGNVYAGKLNIDNANLTVKADDQLIVKDGIEVKAASTTNRSLAKENYHFVHEGGALWTEGITLDGAAASLNGDIYVRDDLTLNGKDSIASVAGSYMGYSNPKLQNNVTDEAAVSSAILVNGRDSVIDFTNLNDLLLAGNGYVDIGGTSKDYLNSSDENSAVRMGESIAIKSNQLAYLAPESAIRVSNGTIVESGNPVTVKVDDGYKQSDLSLYLNTRIKIRELGNQTLSDLGINAGDCKSYVVQQANADGTLTIYVYMDLDAEHAASYFAARYGENTEKYAKIYLPSVAAGADFTNIFHQNPSNMRRMDLNGNILNVAAYNLGDKDVQREIIGYQNAFKALTKKLILSYSNLSDTEKSDEANIFTNLVDETAFDSFLAGRGGKVIFRTPVTEMDAVLTNGNYEVTAADAKVRLIVAKGDVTVNANFQGLIIAKGNVTISHGANITAVPEETAAVFQCIYGTDKQEVKVGDKVMSPMALFHEGEQYLLNGIASGYISGTLGEQINLVDYIKFENWKKQ